MHVHLENVLLRDPTLTAGEILMSESQERMMAIVTPEKLEACLGEPELTRAYEVDVAPDVAAAARRAVERMIAIGQPGGGE